MSRRPASTGFPVEEGAGEGWFDDVLAACARTVMARPELQEWRGGEART
jgi:hypothetical protein